jgi:hypothetical protein
MYYQENTFDTRKKKQKFPASNISSSFERAFHSTYDLRKTIEAALQNNNIDTQRQDTTIKMT